MLAAVLYGEEELRVEPIALPRIGPADVLVKVRVALTCGTDLKVFRRGYHARMIQPPAILGHELAGDIVAVGSEVPRLPHRAAGRGGKLGALLELLLLSAQAREPLRKSAV